MISAKVLAKQIEKFTTDNAPVILTAIGVGGSISSVILAVKGSFRSSAILEEERERIYRETPNALNTVMEIKFSKRQYVELLWKEYLPAAGTLSVTVAAIILANRINTKRPAALAAAYSLSEKAYGEYREKVVEKFNANKERQVRDEIAQDHVTANPPTDAQIIITGNGDVLCHDLPTGRYFKSNMEKLRSVQNDINAQVNEVGHATLSDFYVALGLTTTPYSEALGWTSSKLMEIHFSAVLTDESQPCISINYVVEPIRGSSFRTEGCMEDPGF